MTRLPARQLLSRLCVCLMCQVPIAGAAIDPDFGDAPLGGDFNYGVAEHAQPTLLETLTVAATGAWQSVSLQGQFTSPVVVCIYNLPTSTDNDAVVRLRSVTASGFDLRLQHPALPADTTAVTPSTVDCLVAEEGLHTLPGGRVFEAHRVQSTGTNGRFLPGTWNSANSENVSASGQVLGSYSNLVVLGQVMSYNDSLYSAFWSHACGSRQSPPAAGSDICVGKQVGEDSSGRLEETLGYILVDAGAGNLDGVAYEAALGSDSVRGVGTNNPAPPPYAYALTGSYAFAAATLSAMDGQNGGWAVLFGPGPVSTQLNLAIDEDTINDGERAHTTEQVAYWVFGDAAAVMALNAWLGAVPPDSEAATQDTPAADGDDVNDSSGSGAGDDEDGVSFRSPAGSGDSIFADVVVNNPASADVTVCGWLDIPPAGSTVDGVFDSSDGSCLLAPPGNSTQVFQWAGLPADGEYTTYARFRVSSEVLSPGQATGQAVDGEVEDYQVVFNFDSPTAVTIGKVALAAEPVDQFLDGIGTATMDLNRLQALASVWGHEPSAEPSRQAIEHALRAHLDPDEDGRVAVLSWDTLEERGTLGFYVERRTGGGSWQRVSQRLLPGLIVAPMGGQYQLADPGAVAGVVYEYRLIEQEARGSSRSYGPYRLGLNEQSVSD